MPRAFTGAGLLPEVSEKRMFKDYTLQTTWGRALVALVVGAVVGAMVISLISIFDSHQTPGNVIVDRRSSLLDIGLVISGVLAWSLRFLVIGLPLWAATHFLGLRTWRIALAAGFMLAICLRLYQIIFETYWSFPESFVWLGLAEKTSGGQLQINWLNTILHSALFGLVGATIALAAWHTAYHRAANLLKDKNLQTSQVRVALALIAGAILGATIITVLRFSKQNIYVWNPQNVEFTISQGWGVFLYTLFYWSVPLLIVAVPAWYLLHAKGYRTNLAFLISGFVIAHAITIFFLTDFLANLGRISWTTALQAAPVGALGAATALTIWRIAYHRPTPC